MKAPLRNVVGAGLLAVLVAGCEGRDMTIAEAEVQVLRDQPGRGRMARAGNTVCIDFKVLVPEAEDHSSDPEGEVILRGEDFCFQLGQGAVIEGIDQAVPGMRSGGRRIVKVPPHRHWGRPDYGNGAIPSDTPLVIHLRLVEVE